MNEIETKDSDKIGPLVGSVIIIAVIVLGAFYLFDQIKERIEKQEEQKQIQQEQEKVSESDDVTEIESELQATEVDSMDEEMQSLEMEFKMQ